MITASNNGKIIFLYLMRPSSMLKRECHKQPYNCIESYCKIEIHILMDVEIVLVNIILTNQVRPYIER